MGTLHINLLQFWADSMASIEQNVTPEFQPDSTADTLRIALVLYWPDSTVDALNYIWL